MTLTLLYGSCTYVSLPIHYKRRKSRKRLTNVFVLYMALLIIPFHDLWEENSTTTLTFYQYSQNLILNCYRKL